VFKSFSNKLNVIINYIRGEKIVNESVNIPVPSNIQVSASNSEQTTTWEGEDWIFLKALNCTLLFSSSRRVHHRRTWFLNSLLCVSRKKGDFWEIKEGARNLNTRFRLGFFFSNFQQMRQGIILFFLCDAMYPCTSRRLSFCARKQCRRYAIPARTRCWVGRAWCNEIWIDHNKFSF
jgi:hypothetical protein